MRTTRDTMRTLAATLAGAFLLTASTAGAQGPGAAQGGPVAAAGAKAPQTFEELWADFDPRREPMEAQVVRQWQEEGLVLRYVTYTIGTFRGAKARMAAFYGFPKGASRLPAVMHMHGGGQRAFLHEVRQYAGRGYACLSVNWGGREMEGAQPGEPGTDWGAVDPTQNNVPGYSSLMPGPKSPDLVPSPRNNNWYLLTIGCRRGITFLEQQAEVDPNRIGVYGHSMGGQLTGLVAGTDDRVKAAAPSVGGSGFLQTDLWGLPGSARPVRGDPALFEATLSGQQYLRRVRCPILWLGATNDFNSPMDFVTRGMALVPHERKRMTFAPHLNHRFTPETDVCRPLWFDAHLKGTLVFPAAPRSQLVLTTDDGVPVFRVMPDLSRPVERVDLYYGYDRDPRVRFWADARAVRKGDGWEGACPVMDLGEPLFAFANVYHKLEGGAPGDPPTFALSTCQAAYPEDLQRAGVKVTQEPQRLIDDFVRGWHDWYVLNGNNRHHWYFGTQKLVDPRWVGPAGGKLCFDVHATEPDNVLAVRVVTDAWRSYTGRKSRTYVARVPLPAKGWQTVALAAGDFMDLDAPSEALADWGTVTELAFQAADKALKDAALTPWRGEVPRFRSLRWEGGPYAPRPKPYLPAPRPGRPSK